MADLTNSNSFDWSNAAASAVQTAGSIGSQLLAGWQNRKSQERSQAWSEKMWNAQNEYNLPINQMKRLKEAGINPNLAFGSSASAMGTNVPSPPHYSDAPDYSRSINQGISDYFSRKFEKMSVIANVEYQQEQARKLRLENDTTEMLLSDERAFRRSKYSFGALKNYIDSTYYARQKGLEVDYLSSQWLNSMDRYFAHLPAAQAAHYGAMDELLKLRGFSEYEDYLTKRSKGRFERGFYDRGLNPYETSTIAGALRSIFALGEEPSYFGVPSDYFSPSPRRWFNFTPTLQTAPLILLLGAIKDKLSKKRR